MLRGRVCVPPLPQRCPAPPLSHNGSLIAFVIGSTTLVVAALVIQWAILVQGFFECLQTEQWGTLRLNVDRCACRRHRRRPSLPVLLTVARLLLLAAWCAPTLRWWLCW